MYFTSNYSVICVCVCVKNVGDAKYSDSVAEITENS